MQGNVGGITDDGQGEISRPCLQGCEQFRRCSPSPTTSGRNAVAAGSSSGPAGSAAQKESMEGGPPFPTPAGPRDSSKSGLTVRD